MHPLRTAKSPKPLSSHTPFGMRQELTRNKFPLGVGHRECEHSMAQAKESVFERHQRVNTLGTGPGPYSWLYLQGLAWYLTIYKHACWERSDWKENGELPKTSKLSQSPGMMVKGNCQPLGNIYSSGFDRDSILFTYYSSQTVLVRDITLYLRSINQDRNLGSPDFSSASFLSPIKSC